jgi:hypothetical protein
VEISLCTLYVLCVSVVENSPRNHHGDTENTEVAQRRITTDYCAVVVLGAAAVFFTYLSYQAR